MGRGTRRPCDAVPRRGQVSRRVPSAAVADGCAAPSPEAGLRSAARAQSRAVLRRGLMEAKLLPSLLETTEGREADAILRACVHCAFCTATCPTYQLLGDELDGPRGRIYLIKQALEGGDVTAKTQLHLDRCLSCRSRGTTWPAAERS